jgi:hypothetical protein
MPPKKQELHDNFEDMGPTSPWTESYQAASEHRADYEQTPSQPQFADDSEIRPTQDALSDIYNRGY